MKLKGEKQEMKLLKPAKPIPAVLTSLALAQGEHAKLRDQRAATTCRSKRKSRRTKTLSGTASKRARPAKEQDDRHGDQESRDVQGFIIGEDLQGGANGPSVTSGLTWTFRCAVLSKKTLEKHIFCWKVYSCGFLIYLQVLLVLSWCSS